MYQALYRKWRPLVFSDVVGQRHITDTLRTQLKTEKLSHAYLFTGTRGTGKTTCAKILARAVNCQNPVNGDPCNTCPSCKGILDGSILDVVEIDAASNNGVDNIRDIREETRYTPANVKKRVYIIDEVHMLSIGAFNALLKTLEEPPEHVLFILATTEIHKVPATILSRCQRFDFRRIAPKDIVERLIEVAEGEGIQVTQDGAKMIARLSDGAMRDALSILDRASASGDSVIDEKTVAENVGILASDSAIELMELIKQSELSRCIELLTEYYVSGRDLGAVLDQLMGLIRDMLLVKTSRTDVSELISPAYSLKTVQQLCEGISSGKLVAYTDIINASLGRMSKASNRRIEAEVCVIKLCEISGEEISTLTGRIEELEEKLKNGVVVKEKKQDGKNKPVSNNQVEDTPPWEEQKPQPIKKEVVSDQKWTEILQALTGKINIGVHTNLKLSSKAVFVGDTLKILPDDDITAMLASSPDVKKTIGDVTEQVMGQKYKIEVLDTGDEEKLAEESSPIDEVLQKAKELNIQTNEL